MKLSLGPVQYYWSREDLQDFYRQMAELPVDIVYLGETVCSKRRLFRYDDWLETAQMLRDAGKEVVLSSMALLEAESELKSMRRICANDEFLVEANDMAAVQLMSAAGLPFSTGPTVNIYNGATLKVLAEAGLIRWVLPVELGQDTLSAILDEAPQGVETEVFAWGRIPLAMSARCYTARAYDLPKDDCQYRCLDHADGMTLRTREGEPFLAINGIQTQSALTCNLLGEVKAMKDLGVDVLRISPQARHTEKVIRAFADVLAGQENLPDLERLMPVGGCDGYWRGEAGMSKHT
jgi:collagenase-like PrtC family protease